MKVSHDMWLKGWDERNAGNASIWLHASDTMEYINSDDDGRLYPLFTKVTELAGAFFLVTGAGKYFRNIILNPKENIAIIRIDKDGTHYRILWGLAGGGVPTSELPTHLFTHAAQSTTGRDHTRVILHTHPTNLVALSFVLEFDTKVFTKQLWEMNTECLVVFPDGIGVLPWGVLGTEAIGQATSLETNADSGVMIVKNGKYC